MSDPDAKSFMAPNQLTMPSLGGGGVTQYGGTLVHIHVQKKNVKRGDFCHRLLGSRDLQKGGIFAKNCRCSTEDTPVTPIKGVLW